MKDCMLIGIALGFIAGALVISQNKKAQEIVENSKKAMKNQVKKIMD